MEQTNRGEKGMRFNDILLSFKKNWVLILVVVVLFSVIGWLYGRYEKPVYTAKHQTFYSTHNFMVEDPNAAEHINAARALMDTVADFCDEENVVKRADYLYSQYLKAKETNDTLSASQFLKTYSEINYKKYSYNELSELLQQPVDVFFRKEVVENNRKVIRPFVFRGILLSRSEGELNVKSTSGHLETISADDFIYAVKTDSYQSEYSFNELSLIPQGTMVKAFMLTNTGINLPTNLTGEYVGSTENDLTIKVGDVDVKIIKENFKKATLVNTSYFDAGKIDVDYSNGAGEEDESFVFTFKYTDDTIDLAKEKVQFVIKAAAIETTIYTFDEDKAVQAKFVLFKNVEVTLDGAAGYLGATSSVSKTRTFIVFFAIGMVVGLLVAYIKEIMDKTVKKKDDLEMITETKVLTVIPAEEDR